MHRALCAGVLVGLWILTAGGAGAATLTLESDKPTYVVGETIVLTVTGFSEGAKACCLFARIDYDPALTEGVSSSQIVHTSMNGGASWIGGGAQGIQGDGTAFVLDQVFPSCCTPVSTDPTPTIGTVTLIAEAEGVVQVSFFVSPGDTLTLNYFGITSLPGISFTIIPEPGSAALLALGIAGLVAARARPR